MDDRVKDVVYFLLWPLPATVAGLLYNFLLGALPHTHYEI